MAVSDIDSIVCEITIAAPPETVFSFFTDPDLYVRWMGAQAQLDPRPGGWYAVDINNASRARGTFVEVVPHSRILFTFGWEGDDQALPPARARSKSRSRRFPTERTCASTTAVCSTSKHVTSITRAGCSTCLA